MLKQLFSSALFLVALAAGLNSATAIAAPVIQRQPVSQAVVQGSSVTLSVEASDPATNILSYQWFYGTNLAPITAGMFLLTNAVEAQRSELVLANSAFTNTGVFSVVVSGNGSVTSAPAKITVVTVPQSQLRVLNVTVAQTNGLNRFSFPLTFAALGNDRAVGVQFGFDPAVIQNVTFTENTALFTNDTATVTRVTNEISWGRFAFVYTLPPTTNFFALQQLGTLSFDDVSTRTPVETLAAAKLYTVTDLPPTDIAPPLPPLPAATLRANGTNLADLTTFPLTVILSPQIVTSSPVTLNRQTGYFQQTADVVNIDAANNLSDVLLSITGLTNDSRGVPVALATAVGTSGSPAVPYIFLGPLTTNATRRFTLEYYISDGQADSLKVPGYDAVGTLDSTVVTVTGRRSILPTVTPVPGGSGVLLDFETLTNFNYYVRYSDSLTDFSAQTTNSTAILTARPVMRGTGRKVQWLDNGPPRTQSVPTTNRFYRILEFR